MGLAAWAAEPAALLIEAAPDLGVSGVDALRALAVLELLELLHVEPEALAAGAAVYLDPLIRDGLHRRAALRAVNVGLHQFLPKTFALSRPLRSSSTSSTRPPIGSPAIKIAGSSSRL